MWAELRLRAPGIIGHQARQLLAKGADARSARIPPAFFHRDETGNTRNEPALIRLTGDGKSVTILGVSAAGALLLYEHAVEVARIFGAEGRPFTLRDGLFSAEPLPYTRAYSVGAFILRLPYGLMVLAREGQLTDPRLLEHVRKTLVRAIENQIAWLCPDARVALDVSDLVIKRSVAVRMHADQGPYRTSLDLEFSLPVALEGPWQVGQLQARGNGRLRRALGAKSQSVA